MPIGCLSVGFGVAFGGLCVAFTLLWQLLVFRCQGRYIKREMSLAEIEAELEKLSSDELRRLALRSWTAFVEKEGGSEAANECSEEDPRLLAALDEAIAKADATPGEGHSADSVRTRLDQWTSK